MVPASCLGQVDNKKQNPVTALIKVGMCPGQQGQDGTKLSHSLAFMKPAAGSLPIYLRTFLKHIFH